MIDDVLVDVLRRTGKMSRADLVRALNLNKRPSTQIVSSETSRNESTSTMIGFTIR